jgi:hypothetical protein
VKFSQTTIKEVWNGEFMNKLRKAHMTNNFSCHKFCGNCPDWENTKWPDEGRSYSNVMNDLMDAEEVKRKKDISVPSDLI